MSDSRMDLPVPPLRRGREPLTDFATFRVDESRFFAGRRQSTVCAAAKAAGKRLGFQFTTRAVEEEHGGAVLDGIRVWREA